MVKKTAKNNKKPRNKLKLRQKLKIKVKEIPALLRAKREEKIHVPTFSELKKETHEFEKEGYSLKRVILTNKKKKLKSLSFEDLLKGSRKQK